MRIRTVAAALLVAASFTISPAQAQTSGGTASLDMPTRPLTSQDLEGLRAELGSSRKQLMAQHLRLTDGEATRFWPVYDRYQADLAKIRDEQVAIIVEYANTFGSYSDAAATDLITRWLAQDVRTAELRARYVPIVGQVLPGVKAATFFQIDGRISMLIDQRVASMLPVLQFQGEAAR
jgi:Spy/CpxP family protein refolding chaperone